jgi:PKD repeat protein
MQSVALSAGQSTDEDGQIAAFAWSFGDGKSAEGPEVSHAYGAPGIYELVLTADDGLGLSNSRKQSVLRFPVNRPPRAEAGPDRLVCPGEVVALDASSSVDWDNHLTGYHWEFGDGTSGEGAQVSHRFAEPGVYEVRLTVSDDSGSNCSTHTDVAQVTVNAPPLAAVDGDEEGFAGGAHDELLFDASTSTDADGQPLSFVWDLGDGIVLAGDKVRHSYAKAGTYPVRLTVSDGSGLACGEGSQAVQVTVKPRE